MYSRYNPKESSIIVDDVYITGLGEDAWNFEKEEDLAEDTVGVHGDVVRNENNDPRWKATITVQRTSPQYKFLRDLKKRTEPFSIYHINKALGIKEGGAIAMPANVPASKIGKTAEDSEFVFTVYDGDSTDA